MTIKKLARECTRQLGILGFVRLARALKKWMAWKPYDQQLLEFYLNFFQPGGLVFDIGANIGMRTKVFIKGGLLLSQLSLK